MRLKVWLWHILSPKWLAICDYSIIYRVNSYTGYIWYSNCMDCIWYSNCMACLINFQLNFPSGMLWSRPPVVLHSRYIKTWSKVGFENKSTKQAEITWACALKCTICYNTHCNGIAKGKNIAIQHAPIEVLHSHIYMQWLRNHHAEACACFIAMVSYIILYEYVWLYLWCIHI